MTKQNTKSSKGYILVAEDDKFYADIYHKKLSEEGYEVEIVENGERALRSMRKRKPDLVLLDLIMPVKDGFDVIKEVRNDDKLKDIKILTVTNLGEREDVERIKKMGGVSEHVVKANVSLQEIIQKIKNYINI